MNKCLLHNDFIEVLCEEVNGDDDDDEEEEVLDETDLEEEVVPLDMSRVKCEADLSLDQPLNMCSKRTKSNSRAVLNGTENKSADNQSKSTVEVHSTQPNQKSAENHGSHGLTERWNRNGKRTIHEDEEEDDDEDNDLHLGDRLLSEQSSGAYDPERLKAFNVWPIGGNSY